MAPADALVRTKRIRLKWRPPGQRTVSTNFESDCLEFRRGQSAHVAWNCRRGRCGLIFSATHSRWVRTYTLPPKKGPFQGPMIFGGEGGIDSAHPCASPLRGRFAVQIGCPADLSNRCVRTYTLTSKTTGPKGPDDFWRRGWDSNPRRATNPCWFSRPVHSTALPPLRSRDVHATAHFARCQQWIQPDFVQILNCADFAATVE